MKCSIMNSLKIIIVFVVLFSNATLLAQQSKDSREKLCIDMNWKFQLADQTGAEKISYDDSKWRALDLPHDWSIEGTYNENEPTGSSGGYLPTSIGWYRHYLEISKTDLSKNISILFDGVYMNSDVWINGHHLGKYPYGYSSFYYELSKYLTAGKNVIAVKVDNSKQPNTRWYTGSGIYRHVWLVKTNPVHLSMWGVYVTTPFVSADSATIVVQSQIENNSNSTKEVVLRADVIDRNGKIISVSETPFMVESGKQIEVGTKIKIADPKLWTIESPNLYKLQTSIVEKKNTIDNVVTTFGVRSISYDVDKGFFLNGKRVKMNGVCIHHDGGSVGAAVPEKVWERRLKLLKEMGC
ncbi:MAG: beta galactosidase jelly roll domain-containing protein, partial [Ignavibacteria bacterium]|nr:beta galactosidase jelly roll domain-containing protein [Ignavibacteria bacterium]